jgi:hypothetical protein
MIDKFMLDKACKVLSLVILFWQDKKHKKFQKDFRIEIHTIEKSIFYKSCSFMPSPPAKEKFK